MTKRMILGGREKGESPGDEVRSGARIRQEEEDEAARGKRRGARRYEKRGGCSGSTYVKVRTDRHPRDPLTPREK